MIAGLRWSARPEPGLPQNLRLASQSVAGVLMGDVSGDGLDRTRDSRGRDVGATEIVHVGLQST